MNTSDLISFLALIVVCIGTIVAIFELNGWKDALTPGGVQSAIQGGMKMQSRQGGFTKGWLIYNLVGWVIGGLIVIASLPPLPMINYPDIFGDQFERARAQILSSMLFWLPLSASVAIMQWLKLRHWNIPGVPWVLATTLAWVLPPTFLPLLLDSLHIPYFESWNFGGQVAQLIMVTLSVGVVQSAVMHSSRSMSALWIIAYLVGSFALAFLAILTWGVGYSLGKSLGRFFLSQGEIGVQIVMNRDALLLSFVLLIIPIWATLAIGLPTGLIFSKHGPKQEAGEFDASSYPVAQ